MGFNAFDVQSFRWNIFAFEIRSFFGRFRTIVILKRNPGCVGVEPLGGKCMILESRTSAVLVDFLKGALAVKTRRRSLMRTWKQWRCGSGGTFIRCGGNRYFELGFDLHRRPFPPSSPWSKGDGSNSVVWKLLNIRIRK